MEQVVLGLDCGQTSCKACLAKLDGTVITTGQGGAIEHLANPDGLHRSGRSVVRALEDLRHNAAGRQYEIALASIGFSGITPQREGYLKGWINEVFPVEKFLIAGDAPVNLAGAVEIGPETVVVIAGGGSVAWATGPDGKEIASGGWSHIFGDEGSGWQIGRSAAIAALRSFDGRGPTTALEPAVAEHFQLHDAGGIKELYYSHQIGDPDLARLVPVVAKVAAAGDAVAVSILIDAGKELGLAAATVIRRMGWAGREPEVVATGGVFKAGDLLWHPFCEVVHAVASRARIRRARFDPVIGAVILGLKALGVMIGPELCDRMERSLRALSE